MPLERCLTKKRFGLFLIVLASVAAQIPDGASLPDLPRLKNYSAHRASSENRYVGSNDDSKRIMPGETLVMADLTGPGVVESYLAHGGR